MRPRNSVYANKSKAPDVAVSAFMEQTNLFSLSNKRKAAETKKIIPIYLKSIDKYDFFYDTSLESFNIPKEEYLAICKDIQDMYFKIYSTNLKSKKLWILKRFGQIGFAWIFIGIVFYICLCYVANQRYNKFVSGFLSAASAIYFILVTIFCLFYITKVFKNKKNSAVNIKKLNTYVFRLNIQYREKNTQFRFVSSTKELIISKIL